MQQSLGNLLKQAASEPGLRPIFFQSLLASEVWLPQGAKNLQSSDEVEITHWRREDGSTVVPFFTDKAALQQACGKEQASISLPAKQLFNITKGQVLFLNPELPEGKLFTAGEISTLLENPGGVLASYQIIEKEQILQINTIPTPPEQLVESLQHLFPSQKRVRQAYLAKFREVDEQTDYLMIALELDPGNDDEIIIQQTGNVAIDVMTESEVIDVCVIDPKASGLSHLLTAHFTPFYQRKWGSFLRDIQEK